MSEGHTIFITSFIFRHTEVGTEVSMESVVNDIPLDDDPGPSWLNDKLQKQVSSTNATRAMKKEYRGFYNDQSCLLLCGESGDYNSANKSLTKVMYKLSRCLKLDIITV